MVTDHPSTLGERLDEEGPLLDLSLAFPAPVLGLGTVGKGVLHGSLLNTSGA
jgi:hypothetical protein